VKKMSYTLSPTSLSLFKDCPRCFWRQFKEGVKRPNGIFPSLPSGMDRILKEHFDYFMKRGELPPELHTLKHMRLFDDEPILSQWRNFRKGIRWSDEKGNVICGAIDNILVHKEKLVVLDYKTRGFPLKNDTHEYYQDQLNVYCYLLHQNGYEVEDYAYLLFYHPNKVTTTGEVLFHNDLKKIEISTGDAERLIQKAINLLNGDCPSKKCVWCQLNKD
ncbi:MAG: PD-(D/E)XK nuclease family protein, partial [Candidatus Diapherotrites archaeon]|nr:PD-(D/E)XK nuclease family protein [Candidatus Diapherotrites archaeon]